MSERVPCRIAMWSGPRNVSTALMRSWGNRDDTHVADEPFYAYYLTQRPTDHPGVEAVIELHETDWRKVVAALTGPVPGGKAVFYQKHMAHHLLPEVDRGWMAGVQHCFLIRHPREVVFSLVQHMPHPTVRDTGFPQEAEIFDYVCQQTGQVPPVVDARDLLRDPERILRLLCERLGVAFSARMLSWPAGQRATDGIWGRYWYAGVRKSTGFQAYVPREDVLSAEHMRVFWDCLDDYRKLYAHRLGADG